MQNELLILYKMLSKQEIGLKGFFGPCSLPRVLDAAEKWGGDAVDKADADLAGHIPSPVFLPSVFSIFAVSVQLSVLQLLNCVRTHKRASFSCVSSASNNEF